MILFRAAHTSEAAVIAGMSRLHIEYGLRWRWTPAKVRRHILDPETMALVTTRDGIISGFAIMRFGDTTAHLLLLAVDPKARRMGLGRGMLEWLEKSCVTAGIQHIRLEVRSDNNIAHRFYQALGFRPLGQLDAYYDSEESATIFGKSLIGTDQAIGPAPD